MEGDKERLRRIFTVTGVQKVRPGIEVKPELTEAAPIPLTVATECSAAEAPAGTIKDMMTCATTQRPQSNVFALWRLRTRFACSPA